MHITKSAGGALGSSWHPHYRRSSLHWCLSMAHFGDCCFQIFLPQLPMCCDNKRHMKVAVYAAKKSDQENLIAVFVEHVNGLKFWVCCHFRTIRSNCGVLQKRQIGLPKVWIHSAFAQQFLAKFHHGPVPWPSIVLPRVFFHRCIRCSGKIRKKWEKMWKICHGLF